MGRVFLNFQKYAIMSYVTPLFIFCLFSLYLSTLLYAGEGGMGNERKNLFNINLKEGEISFNDFIKFAVDGYTYMLLPETQGYSTVMVNSSSFTSAGSQEVIGSPEVYLGSKNLYEVMDYSRKKVTEQRTYLRIRPWLHLFIGEMLSFHGRVDVATGHLDAEHGKHDMYHQWDFGYGELKFKGFDVQMGLLSFNDPLDSTFDDPNLLIFSNTGTLCGQPLDSHPEGFEGILISTKDVFDPLKLRFGYFNSGWHFMGDEINMVTAQSVYSLTDSLSLMLYEYVIIDKNNVQFPGLGGKDSHSYYTGIYLKQKPKPFGYSANFIYLGGTIHISPNHEKRSIDRKAWVLHLTADYQLAKETLVGIKYAHSTGDTDPNDHNSKSWWGINADYLGTNFFFDYGFGTTLNGQLSVIDPWSGRALGINLVGPYWKTSLGFISPHLSKFYLNGGLYYIGAAEKSPINGKRSVGAEFDNILEYHIVKDKFILAAEADIIGGGNLYEAPKGINIDTSETSWKAMLVAYYNF
jgi:hypothetical protein